MESMIPSEDPFTNSIDIIEARLSRLECIGMRKLSLPNPWLFSILLAILMKAKNYGILKTLTKIQFHDKILNLTNINPLTNWKVFSSTRLNWKMNVTLISMLWFSFNFWIYADSGILTWFGPNSEANTDSCPHRAVSYTHLTLPTKRIV